MSDDTLLPSEPSNESADTNKAPEAQGVEAKYLWADNMPGEGDAPDWYKGDKYKSVADQAKAYTDLEKRFGGFTGAPEAYELPEEVDPDDTFVKQLTEIGTASNMNQESFGKFLDLGEQLINARDELNQEREMEALGDNAGQRLANIDGFMRNNLGDKYEDLKGVVNNAQTVELIESLISATAPTRLPSGASAPVNIPTQGDIERMMQEKDESGRVLYHYSKSRQKEVHDSIARMKGH